MERLSLALMIAGLASHGIATPLTRSPANLNLTLVPAISSNPNQPPNEAKKPGAVTPVIQQFTPEEFQAWVTNTTISSTVAARSAVVANLGKRDPDPSTLYPQTSTAYPFGSMGALSITTPTSGYLCSGSLVGPRLMLSARHCVVSGATSFLFQPGYGEDDDFSSSYVSSVITLVADDSIGQCDLKNDWALFVLAEPLGTEIGYIPMASYTTDEATVANQPVLYDAGEYTTSSDRQLYMSDSRTTSLALSSYCTNGGPILGDCLVYEGMSGGPLWHRVGDDRYVYGGLFGTATYNDNYVSIHSWGDSLVQGVQSLNTQYPS
ncbi:hypothetical protein BX600DRAFT_435210 [Xylariales sp. PMI_506]|nr:hypothetical protein BX600DRAFT_435210 [Xylariales sp. PMI_506]